MHFQFRKNTGDWGGFMLEDCTIAEPGIIYIDVIAIRENIQDAEPKAKDDDALPVICSILANNGNDELVPQQ
jgi:hypothetical protein